MGQIILPTERKIQGPWLLDNKNLNELHQTLLFIDEKLTESFNILLKKEAESTQLEEYEKWKREITIEEAKQKVEKYSSFNSSDKYALVTTKQGKKIKNEDLLGLLKDSQIDEFNPSELNVYIKKGPCEFTFEVSDKYDGELEIRIKSVGDSILSDINYELNKWINNHKLGILAQKWSFWFPLAAFPLLFLVLLTTVWFLKDTASMYKTELEKESILILKDGLTDAETTKALEIILQYESGYIPESFNPDTTMNDTVLCIWLVTAIILIILSIAPKTVIGLGKNKWKVAFYRIWMWIVSVFIPSSIVLPLILDKVF